jgi:hypothetical protein
VPNERSGNEHLPDGFRLRFDATSETLQRITTVVDVERRCCRFLRFQIDRLATRRLDALWSIGLR